jgi:hypothetical protein
VYDAELLRRAVVGVVPGEIDEIDVFADIAVHLIDDAAQIGVVLQPCIGDVQISDLKEAQRLFGLVEHRIDLKAIKGGNRPVRRRDHVAVRQPSLGVSVLRTMFGSVLLAVVLWPFVLRAVLGLLRPHRLHRFR